MTPPPNLGFFRVILGGWSQILPSTKLFHHRFTFEQICSAMETKKLEETVQQHDEDAESSKTGCRSPSRAHGKDCEQMSALICDSPPHLVRSCHVGGAILLIGRKIAPPNVWGTNLKLLTWISSFHLPPSIISAFNAKWGNPPFQTHCCSLWNCACGWQICPSRAGTYKNWHKAFHCLVNPKLPFESWYLI